MKLELKEMKISRVEMCKASDIENLSLTNVADSVDEMVYGVSNNGNILDPTSFALIIKRNLSSSWYKEIPELDVSGRLNSIVVCV